MRTLILSNIFPTLRSPGQGIFISRRLAAHREAGDDFTAVAVRPTFGKVVRSALAAAGRRTNALVGTDFVDVPVAMSLADVIATSKGGYPSKQLLARAATAVVMEVSDRRFDVVHAHGMYLLPAGAVAQQVAKTLDVPYVVSAHGSDINAFMPARRAPYIEVLDEAASVAYVSDALRDRATQLGANGHNALTLPNGVDTSLFSPAEDTAQPRRSSRRVVAYVGNLVEVKGADRLPEICRGIAAAMPGTSFVIAGDGPLRASIEWAMNGLETEFLGNIPQEHVARVLGESNLVLLPSRSEGWPCVVLEAHACGTPMLASDAGGTPQAVGDPRFVVTSGEGFVQRFVDRAVGVLRGELETGDLRARALGYSWQSIAARETEVLWRVAGRPSVNH